MLSPALKLFSFQNHSMQGKQKGKAFSAIPKFTLENLFFTFIVKILPAMRQFSLLPPHSIQIQISNHQIQPLTISFFFSLYELDLPVTLLHLLSSSLSLFINSQIRNQ
jgi:hypothetical protein